MTDQHEQVRSVVLTALELEFKAVVRFLAESENVTNRLGTIYRVGIADSGRPGFKTAVVQVGPGNMRAAVETERALTFFSPDLVLFVGVAGGIKDVSVGDVVAGTRIYGYESGKDAGEFLARPDVGETSYAFQQTAMEVSRSGSWLGRLSVGQGQLPRAFVGPIAAGEKVVASTESNTFALLRATYGDALAVEMEGRGTLVAAFAHSGVKCGVIRGISDLIDGKAESDRAGSQEFAATNAASYALSVIERFPFTVSRDRLSEPGNLGPADLWAALGPQAVLLYPRGPLEREIWIRAGGDASTLELLGDGQTQWVRALRLLRQGGGGRAITVRKLVDAILEDFPNNPVFRRLVDRS